MPSVVAVVKTSPDTVVADYRRVMHLADYQTTLLIRKGFLQPLEKLLLHSPWLGWASLASNIYHDLLWYPLVCTKHVRAFLDTEWGNLFKRYKHDTCTTR